MKVLVASSKKDLITEEAITKMYSENNNDIPLKRNGETVGHLIRKELIRNKENGALELWGYFAIKTLRL